MGMKQVTKITDDFHAIEMIGNFQLTGLLDADVLVGVTCSCGWQRSEQPEKVLLKIARDHNHYSHYAFQVISEFFLSNRYDYSKCHFKLIENGMEEQRAHDYLDSLRAAKLQACAK